jgi:RimJ/RimL family protein N-acetyltransferase
MHRWTSDDAIRDGLGLRTASTREGTEQWIARALVDDTICAFAIHDGDAHVGMVVLDRIDHQVGTARLHIYVGVPEARGRGIGRGATKLAVARAFGELGLHKVWLTVHARNVRAIATYVSVGFQVEGVLRDEFLLRGERVAALYMGILRSDVP